MTLPSSPARNRLMLLAAVAVAGALLVILLSQVLATYGKDGLQARCEAVGGKLGRVDNKNECVQIIYLEKK